MRNAGKLSALLSCSFMFLAAPLVSGAEPIDLVVLHTNDLHGYVFPREFQGSQLPEKYLGQQVGSLFSAATVVGQWREKLFAQDAALEERFEKTGDDGILFLDAGDSYSGTLDDFESQGENVIEVMTSPHLDVDAAAVGNHDLDFGQERWKTLREKSVKSHPILAANLDVEKGERPTFLSDYAILETRGVKVAVIGLLTETALHAVRQEVTKGLKVTNPMERLGQILEKLEKEGRPDLVMVISHVAFERGGFQHGKPVDYFESIAKMDDDKPGDDAKRAMNVDVVIDGHSHVDHTQQLDANTLLVQADHYGVKLGEVVIRWDPEKKSIVGAPAARRIPLAVSEVPLHEGMSKDFAALVEKVKASNERKVCTCEEGLEIPTLLRTDTGSLANPSGDLLARALLTIGRAASPRPLQVGIINQSGVRAGLYASKGGAITAGTIHAVSPFANPLLIADVKAKDLLDLLQDEGIQHKSKFSWAGLEVEATQKGKDKGAEERRKVTKAVLLPVETGEGKSLADMKDEKVSLIAPIFFIERYVEKIAVPGSVQPLDLLDRQALTDYLVDLEREGAKVTREVLDRKIGTPVKLVVE